MLCASKEALKNLDGSNLPKVVKNLKMCCACSSKCIQLTTGGDNRQLCGDSRETDLFTGTKDLN